MNESMVASESRRTFLKVSVATGGGLLLGFAWSNDVAGVAGEFRPNAWIRIDTDDHVTLRVASSEMGQGVYTALPMILAEELDCDWEKVRVEMAPAEKAYFNPRLGQQLTGGSASVRGFFTPLREAGARARALLLQAAAKSWNVPESECRVANGVISHAGIDRQARYGELTQAAARLPAPGAVFLKEPKDFRLIGKSTVRLDTPLKVNGRAEFGLDVKLPGLLTAVVARCPVFGGKVKSFDASRARAVKGVRQVVQIHSGVAVVADTFWAAKRGLDALTVQWDEGANSQLNSAAVRARLDAALRNTPAVARDDGNAVQALSVAARKISATYEVPYLAHACMEPMNCTARVTRERCELWVGTQNQTMAQYIAQRITGLPPEKINVNTTFLGGGFGRRSDQDFLAEAVELSRRTGNPVKVVWTREDDMRHAKYRPATLNQMSAGLDANGQLIAWRHEMAGASIMHGVYPAAIKKGIDQTSVEGAANLPYAISNLRVTWTMENGMVPVWFWRSVGSSQNAFVTESFLDEVAREMGRDPFGLRRSLLQHKPRHLNVLETAASHAGWATPLAAGRARGIAIAESFGSICAQVAEISIVQNQVRVHRVVCAIDCGTVINPDTVMAQMESAIVFGLTAALNGEITIQDGRVVQGNFNDYPLLRIDEMPQIDVHIIKSNEQPGGVGEPGTPPIAPAVANAVFALTNRPVRKLPIRL